MTRRKANPNRTYKEYKNLFALDKSPQSNQHWRNMAKKKYPEEYKEEDFPKKDVLNLNEMTYAQLVVLYANTPMKERRKRTYYKSIAQINHSNEFNEDDFVSGRKLRYNKI